ncbi:hypothetical protein Btru_037259 [Bulinus truncatus]|nr:hypothetical protein Btru_037259 [Bulinus truncatus]
MSTFKRVTYKDVVMETLNRTENRLSLSQCAARCLSLEAICYSFSFDKTTGLCTLGAWIIPSVQQAVSMTTVVFTRGAFCNTTNDFQLIRGSQTSYCVRLALTTLNYWDAETACQAENAHLFTMKVKEKLSVMQSINQTLAYRCWVGLDDSVTEGTFLWIDDKTEPPIDLQKYLFKPGQPDNSGDEDCVMYDIYNFPLNDQNCSTLSRYVCEMSPM